ncbi:C40 family peptidase [Solicola gregarius]|uniref:NlpC/P60 family protein n=1 Tax=Solicola gregarius TaxID=2908642 RepID=A0AA46TKL9_9ACTN|nr:NlpC/P60 family protein [Solicola gregarius]UYM07015.1 NlpC/P60 family protein [Solicola gregarius]
MCAASLTTASADDDTPTRAEVQSAKADAAQAASDVGSIKAELAAAEQKVVDLGVEAGRLAEAYNGAVYKLQQSRREERRRVDAAADAKRKLDHTIGRMSSALAASASRNTALQSLSALLDENGPRELLEQASGYHSIDDALSADLQKYDARKQVYELLAKRSARAVDRREDLADQARDAKAAADAAVASAQDAEATIRAKRGELIAELATAQGVSESLVRERQRDLQEQREQDALEEAQQEQQEQQQQQEEQQEEQQGDSNTPPDDTTPPPDDGVEDPPDNNGGTDDPPDNNGGTDDPPDNNGGTDDPPDNNGGTDDPPDNNGGTDDPPDNNGGTDDPPDNDPPDNDGNTPPVNTPPATGVNRAIAFARAQLGEPYVYGAAGPSSWDCSGLTMMAWAAAGKSLPHWSVAQYQATTPVSMSSIRRGDLLFWSNGGPSSIYHVALYLGNGMMIQAPRPGRSVEIVSMYYWILPDLAGRV